MTSAVNNACKRFSGLHFYYYIAIFILIIGESISVIYFDIE